MPDGTYQPKVYRKQGGDELVIASGGKLNMESGFSFEIDGTDYAAELEKALGAEAINDGTTLAADELAIPITHRYVAKTTGGDAEALTLADGVNGQELIISLVTDGGGTGTLTPTTAANFVSVAFADAGDTIHLKFVTGVGWVLLGTWGVAAPPVVSLS